MPSIQKQSIQSSIVIMLGFAIGGLNMVLLAPKVLTAEQIGLTRIITDAGITLASLCTLGCLPVINKFFPFYKGYLKPGKNDLPFITLIICITGFILMCTLGYSLQELIVRKFSQRSPLFVAYSYLVYPFGFFMLFLIWLESFSWSLRKSVLSNAVKETLPRLIFTLLLALFYFQMLDISTFFKAFSFTYILPAAVLFIALRKTGEFNFKPYISPVSRRLGGKMINFGLFIFGAQFLNLLSRTVDTFILSAKSSRGLSDAAVFTIATYVVTIMEIPQRSINSTSVPVLAEAWKNKNLTSINSVYKKSVSNLLVIGLVMFSLIWLNAGNLAAYLGGDFTGIDHIVLLMGIGKLIDLGTGANSQIIGTSSYWRVDFFTNVLYTIVALPLNYVLIANYGLTGAAYSSLISVTFYNIIRYSFLWYKFKMQPYGLKNLYALLCAAVAILITYALPVIGSPVIDALIRTALFTVLFAPAIYFIRVSDEINNIILNALRRLKITKGNQVR